MSDSDADEDGVDSRAALVHARALGAIDAVRCGRARGARALDVIDAGDDIAVDVALRAACGRDDDAESTRALARRRAACEAGETTRDATRRARRAARGRADASTRCAPVLDASSHRDEENGWSACHHAGHYGALRCARALATECRNASWERPRDARGRAPVDLVSEKLVRARRRRERRGVAREVTTRGDEDEDEASARFVYAWGSGANYALGTGSTETERAPARVETLTSSDVTAVATNKAHALAVDRDGRLYSWGRARNGALGVGRGGVRAGLDDAGAAATLFPALVSFGGANVRVVRVSAGLSHSACVTADGELYAWGDGRRGKLGFFVVAERGGLASDADADDGRRAQSVPRRVPIANGARIVDVSCGDDHTAALDADGAVWTTGSNAHGQLGYYVEEGGARDDHDDDERDDDGVGGPHSSHMRQVEYLKHRDVVATCVSSAKRHVVACCAAGAAYAWGGGSTAVRRVTLRGGMKEAAIAWHEFDHRIVKVSAGGAHSAALTADGWVYVWESDAERLDARAIRGGDVVDGLCGRAVDVSCGATSSVVVVDTGEAYTWSANEFEFERRDGANAFARASPRSSSPTSSSSRRRPFGPLRRVPGLKGVVAAFAGDAHFFALQRIRKPTFSLGRLDPRRKIAAAESALDRLVREIGAVKLEALSLDSEREDDAREDVDDVVADDDEDEDDEDEDEPPAGAFPTLKMLAEKAVADALVEPRNVLDVVQLADQINARALKRYAIEYAILNLDVVLLETPLASLDALDEEILGELTATLTSGDVVDAWRPEAMETRGKAPASDEMVRRAATMKPRVRVPPTTPATTTMARGRPPLAARAAVETPSPANESRSSGKAPASTPASTPTTTKTKGSLSMFLAGDLEDRATTSAFVPASTSPRASPGPSLRDIQSQQERASATRAAASPRATDGLPHVFSPSPSSPGAFSLGDLIRVKQRGDGKPAWKTPARATPSAAAAAGSPSSTNMRDILAAEASAASRRRSNDGRGRFPTHTGFDVSRSPSDRWYVPSETRAETRSLRDILDDERRRAEEAEEAEELAAALAAVRAAERAETNGTTARARRRPRRGKQTGRDAEPPPTPPSAAEDATPTTSKKTKKKPTKPKKPTDQTREGRPDDDRDAARAPRRRRRPTPDASRADAPGAPTTTTHSR